MHHTFSSTSRAPCSAGRNRIASPICALLFLAPTLFFPLVGGQESELPPEWNLLPWELREHVLENASSFWGQYDQAVAYAFGMTPGTSDPLALVPAAYDEAIHALATSGEAPRDVYNATNPHHLGFARSFLRSTLALRQPALVGLVDRVGDDDLQRMIERSMPRSIGYAYAYYVDGGGGCVGGPTEGPYSSLVYCLIVPLLLAAPLILLQILFNPPAGTPFSLHLEMDATRDGYGDAWQNQLGTYLSHLMGSTHADDLDGDLLSNIDEFRWLTIPIPPQEVCQSGICSFVFPNARDYEGDHWEDGEEAVYWNDPSNDPIVFSSLATTWQSLSLAPTDPDQSLNFDRDNLTTTHDQDSDDDGLLDGDEFHTWQSYPEFEDSDCGMHAGTCKAPREQTRHVSATTDQTRPGSGDGMNDSAELSAWATILPDAWLRDYDRDGIPTNLLDPDADGDEILDGVELGCGDLAACTSATYWDTDRDGLLDGYDVTVSSADVRHTLFKDPALWPVAHRDNPDGSRTFLGELSRGTFPRGWDTDGDTLPDGWEAQYNLSSSADDRSMDPDFDGLANFYEYRCISPNPGTPSIAGCTRPSAWSEAAQGTWWYGTNPQNRDTDLDAATDRNEVDHGTNPRDGLSTHPGGAPPDNTGIWYPLGKANPANSNIPLDRMDPTHLSYLENDLVVKSANADQAVDVVDQAISALIAGNVTQALAVAYNATPVGPPLQDAAATVAAVPEAVLGMVRCSTEAINQTTRQVTSTEILDNATGCTSETLLPFLDPIVNRTLTSPSTLADTAQSLVPVSPPGVVSAARPLVAPVLPAAQRALLGDPTPLLDLAPLDIDELLSGTQDPSHPLPASRAAQAIDTNPLIPTTGRHPTFAFDTIHALGLGAFWPQIQEANRAAAAQGLDPIATVDSFAFNLYTERNGVGNVTRVLVGERTGIQLDGGTATRDANGYDLYATLTVSARSVPQTPESSAGYRVTPTLRLETAVPGAGFDLVALGYLQVANAPYVMVLGYSTLPGSSGQPHVWEGTLRGYDTRETANRSFSYASRFDDPRASIPLHLVGGAFKVDTSEPDKPVLNTHQTTLEAESPAATSGFAVDLARVADPTPAADADTFIASLDVSAISDWNVQYDDTIPDRTGSLTWMAAGMPAGQSRASWGGRPEARTQWSWSAPAQTAGLELHAREEGTGRTPRAFQIVAQDVPTSLELAADALNHRHTFSAGSAFAPTSPQTLLFLVAEGATACPSLEGLAAGHLLVRTQPGAICAGGRLDHHSSLSVQAAATSLLASGAVSEPGYGRTTIVVRDGHDTFLSLGGTPSSWSLAYETQPNLTRQLSWAGSGGASSLELDATLQRDATRQERFTASLTGVPATLTSIVDLLADTATLEAGASLPTASFAFTTTGKAPTFAPAAGGDFFRIRKIPHPTDPSPQALGLEAAYKLDNGRRVLVRVLPDGSFALDADLQAAQPLNVRYEREGYQVSFDSNAPAGRTALNLHAGDGAGNVTLAYAAAAAAASATLAAKTPFGTLHWTSTGVPTDVLLQADTARQLFSLEMPTEATAFAFRHAAPGANVASPAGAGGSNHVFIREARGPTTERSVSVQLSHVSRLHLAQVAGDIHLDAQAALIHPVFLGFTQLNDTYTLDLSETPPRVDITQKPGLFQWSATGSGSTAFTYTGTRPDEPRHLVVSATQTPGGLETRWTPRHAGLFNATLRHDGAAPLGSLQIDESSHVPGSSAVPSGTLISGTALAAETEIDMRPATGAFRVSSRSGSGAPVALGGILAAFTSGTSLPTPPPTWGGDYVLLSEKPSAVEGSIRLGATREASGDLFASPSSPAGEVSSISFDRIGARSFLIDAIRDDGAEAHVKVADAAGRFSASIQSGFAGGAEGFVVTLTGGAAGGESDAYIAKGDRVLHLTTEGTTPATASMRWRAGSPFEVDAGAPLTAGIGYTDTSGEAPFEPDMMKDFVALKNAERGEARLGARISGVQRLVIDLTGGRLETQADAVTVRPVIIDHADANGRISLVADDLPSSLAATWNVTARNVQLTAGQALARFHIETRPTSDHASRLHVALDGVPAGITRLAQNPFDGTLVFRAPSAVGLVRIAADHGGALPLRQLDETGLRLDRFGEANEIQARFFDIQSLETRLGQGVDGPSITIQRAPGASSTPTRVRIDNPDQLLLMNTTGLGEGTTLIEWPRLPAQGDTAVAARFRISKAAPGGELRVATQGRQGEHAEALLKGSPAVWNVTFQPATGRLDYAGSPADTLRLSALWAGGAIDLQATSTPSDLSIIPQDGMRAGEISASGDVGRLRIALAPAAGPGAGGALPSVSDVLSDVLSLDTTSTSGLLVLSMPDIRQVSWNLPQGSAGTDLGALSLTITRASPGDAPALVQLVHPDHQTRLSLPNGLPAQLVLSLMRAIPSWTAALGASQKDATLQHQDARGGQFRMVLLDAPSIATVRLTPKGDGGAPALDYDASGPAQALQVETRWNAGYVRAHLSGLPTKFRVHADGTLLRQGSSDTLGSGTIAKADVLLVPDATATANRFRAPWDYLAVETGGKAPYVGFLSHDLQRLAWSLPDAGTDAPVTADVTRTGASAALAFALSGPGDDLTVKALLAPSAVSIRVQPSTNGVQGVVTPQPLRIVIAPSGPIGRIDLTHVHVETGQTGSITLVGVGSETILTASGAEPTILSVVAAIPPQAAKLTTTDGGTYLLLDVQAPAPTTTGSITRGTCDATTPFMGRIKATGGTTGAIRFQVGDGGRVPPAGRQLDARCSDGRTSVRLDMPFLSETSWEGAPCAASYRFDAGRTPQRYHIETPRGVFDVLTSMATQSQGTYRVEFTNGQGIRHLSSDRMATLEEQISIPTCMQFMTPVDWVRVTGSDVAADLLTNLNPQLGEGVGGAFPTVEIRSPSGARTGTYLLDAHIQRVTASNVWDGQLRFLSPMGFIRTSVFDGAARLDVPNIFPEKIVAVLNGGLYYGTQFSDLVQMEGLAHHECGANDVVRNDYERAAGSSPKRFSVFLDLGDDCDIQRFDVDALPQTIVYTIEWDALTQNKLLMNPSAPMNYIHWWRKVQQIWGTTVPMPGPLYWYVGLERIPAGQTLSEIFFDLPAGHIKIEPTSGRLGHLDIGISLGQATRYVSLGLDNVKGHFEWDLDGDTRFNHNPYYFYGDTAGSVVIGSFRIRFDNVGIGGSQLAFRLDRLELKFYIEPVLGVIPWPNFKRAGDVYFQVFKTPEVYLPNGKWYSLPSILFT